MRKSFVFTDEQVEKIEKLISFDNEKKVINLDESWAEEFGSIDTLSIYRSPEVDHLINHSKYNELVRLSLGHIDPVLHRTWRNNLRSDVPLIDLLSGTFVTIPIVEYTVYRKIYHNIGVPDRLVPTPDNHIDQKTIRLINRDLSNWNLSLLKMLECENKEIDVFTYYNPTSFISMNELVIVKLNYVDYMDAEIEGLQSTQDSLEDRYVEGNEMRVHEFILEDLKV